MRGIYKNIVVIVLLWVFICAPPNVYASEYVDITENCEVTVLKIIDGESMVVELKETKDMAMIKLIGISAAESDTAYGFLSTELLGKNIVVMPDPVIKSSGRFSLVYVFVYNKLFNQKMLVQGHAKVNTMHSNATYYNALTDEATRAELERVGVWAGNETEIKDFLFANSQVNINTASLEQLQTLLYGVDSYLAERIAKFRQLSPFRTVGEIKFVLGFTKDIYDANRNKMVVSTDVTSASKTELQTLTGVTESEIELILDYRERNRIVGTTDLMSYILSISKFDINKEFMDTRPVSSVNFAEPNVIVNINTASLEQLLNTGLDFVPARILIDMRGEVINTNPIIYGGTSTPYKRNYTLKTLGELAYFTGIEFTPDKINSFADNFRLRTDINKAGVTELLSLNPAGSSVVDVLGIIENRDYLEVSDVKAYISDNMYDSINKHMFAQDEAVKERVNINTANKEQLMEAGFSDDQAVKLVYLHRRMKTAYDIPFDLGELDAVTALYTNVNSAQFNELMSLNDGMTSHIASQIISYRDNQPIGSTEELRQIFVNCNAGQVYEYLKDYMVLR